MLISNLNFRKENKFTNDWWDGEWRRSVLDSAQKVHNKLLKTISGEFKKSKMLSSVTTNYLKTANMNDTSRVFGSRMKCTYIHLHTGRILPPILSTSTLTSALFQFILKWQCHVSRVYSGGQRGSYPPNGRSPRKRSVLRKNWYFWGKNEILPRPQNWLIFFWHFTHL